MPTKRLCYADGLLMYDYFLLFVVNRNVEDWKVETGVPSSPVVVQCSDSWTQSGLFCVCYIICEKMTVEGQVSVFQTVKSVKLKRHQIVNSVVKLFALPLLLIRE
jgi:Protein-tyrosine phosphatase